MTRLYATTSLRSTRWQDLFETSLQAQRRDWGKRSGRGHRPDINLPMRLLIASVIKTDRKDREHGTVTRLAEVFATSRQSLYNTADCWGCEVPAESKDAIDVAPTRSAEERRRQVSEAALILLVVGTMSLRQVEVCLPRLLEEERVHGWLSGLVNEAGQLAGKVLEAAD